MRSLRALLTTLAVLVPLSAGATVVAPSAWWIGDPQECELEHCYWDDATWGWALFDETGAIDDPPLGFPDANRATYIVSSGHGSINDVGPATIETTETTANLYIGGWKYDYDDLGHGPTQKHGSPVNKEGRLNIEEGALLTVAEANPICNYLRVGNRGIGEVDQTGGTVRTCDFISMGWDSADALGIWTLRGGTVHTLGFDVGIQGTGFLDIRGGQVEPLDHQVSGLWGQTGVTSIGNIYQDTNTTYSPGVGLTNVRGGALKTDHLLIGREAGSTGVLTVRRAKEDSGPSPSEVKVTAPAGSPEAGGILIGSWGGSGIVNQSGGTVDADFIRLAFHYGSFGQYVIEGGTLKQTHNSGNNHSGLWVGNPSDSGGSNPYIGGIGSLTVVGAGTLLNLISINIADDYYQSARSSLTVVLDTPVPILSLPIAPITVGGTAVFYPGSILDIRVARTGSWGTTNDPAADPDGVGGPLTGADVATYYPNVGARFTILTAPTISGSPTCSPATKDAKWKYKVDTSTNPKKLQIAWCPGTNPGGYCSSFTACP